SSRRRHTRFSRDWSSDVCSSDLARVASHRVWAVAAEGVLKGAAETVGLRTLGQQPLILLNDDFALTRLLRRHFARADIEPRIARSEERRVGKEWRWGGWTGDGTQ